MPLGDLVAELFEDDGARVGRLVDAVPDAHDAFAAAEQGLDVRCDVALFPMASTVLVDGFVRAAVQRALEGADGGGDGGVHVAERRAGDDGGERRSVHLVLGVEDQGDIEDARVRVRSALRR